MRVFLDANILFSASNANSNIAKLIDIVWQTHTAVTCDFAVEEAHRNIKLKRSAWEADFLTLKQRLEVVPTITFELAVVIEAKDKPILCSAIDSSCELLVTGDRRHFGHLYDQTFQATTVVSPVGLALRILKPED